MFTTVAGLGATLPCLELAVPCNRRPSCSQACDHERAHFFRGGMTVQTRLPFVAALGLFLSVTSAAHAQVTKENVPGITNFARVETTVACAGATTPAALTEVKRLGSRWNTESSPVECG